LKKFGRKPLVNPADVVHNYLEARFAMIGFWKKAYGIPFLHVGNVHFRLKFDPIIPDIKLVAFGGEIWLGKNPEEGETSNQIKGAIFGGFNLANPLGNYFYASISELTIGTIAGSFVGKE